MKYYKQLILHVISQDPKTCAETARACGLSVTTTNKHIKAAVESGLLFCVGKNQTSGRHSNIYAAHINHPKPDDLIRGDAGADRTRYAEMVELLQEPMTAREIAENLGITIPAVHARLGYYRAGENEGKHFRICGWVYSTGAGNGWKPTYKAQPGRDVPKPKPDAVANQKRYRAKVQSRARVAAYARRNKGAPNVSISPFDQLLKVSGTRSKSIYEREEVAA